MVPETIVGADLSPHPVTLSRREGSVSFGKETARCIAELTLSATNGLSMTMLCA